MNGRLIDFAEVLLGRAPPRAARGEALTSLPVLALRDIGTHITPRDQLESAQTILDAEGLRTANPGDIVLTARGRLRAAVAEDQHAGVLIGPNLILLRPKLGIPNTILLAFLRHPEVERRLMTEAAGSASAGVSIEGLRQLEVRMPPPDKWHDAVDLIETVEVYHEEIVESARMMRQAVSEWLFREMQILPDD